MNHLYFGDCLDVLRELKAEQPQPFIDLIYIDPPFNSKRNYNVLFESIDLKDANAQKQAFADTWSNYNYIDTLNELAEVDKELYTLLNTFHSLKSISDSAVAYLTTMSIRIYYMHKLLKDTGSFYLHCDSTMSHYLKLVCDMIFGEKNFINEIIWKRTNNPKGSQFEPRKFGISTDTILVYAKTEKYFINVEGVRRQLTEVELVQKYPKTDEKGRYLVYPIVRSASKGERPNLVYEYKGYTPQRWGWVVKKEKLIAIDERGDLGWTSNKTPYRKYRPDEDRGDPIYNLWDEINRVQSNSEESLGYPTQKPVALLERIIQASSNEGDVVADFFCGCGTTIAAAQKLNRKWLGCDISHLAIRLIKKRLVETYGKGIEHNVKIHGMPKDVAAARELAQNVEGGRIGFQDWAIEVMLNGVVNEKKSGDGGYDGYLTFSINGKDKHFALIETKSGKLTVKNVREFINVIETQKAAMGIFVCFEENVTREMIKAAKEVGSVKIGGADLSVDKIQIITVEDLFNGKQPTLPGMTENKTFKKAQRNEDKATSQGLFD